MQDAATPPSRRVPRSVKLAYGFGSIAYGTKDNGFSTLLLLFYNQVIGLPANMVGLAIMIALVLDAVVDPVIGQWSDHTRTRWGRRHPFMYASALPVGLLYVLLWNPPVGASHATILLYLIGVAILVRTAISCYEIPSSALAPELTADYHERTSVLGYRYLFGWIGGMGMALLTFAVFLHPTKQYPVGQLNPAGYHTYAYVAGAVMAVSILLSALGTHREIAQLPKAPPSTGGFAANRARMLATLRNRAFLTLMAAGIFSFAMQGLNFALSTYFNTFLWGFPAAVLAIFAACVILGVILASFVAAAASRIWGKRGASVRCGLLYIAFALTPLLLRLQGWFPSNASRLLLPILMTNVVISTALGVGVAILGASMMSDVVEDAQARTGERSEGLFFAGAFFMQKCVSGLGLLLSGAILTWVHFPVAATPATVTHTVLSHLIVTYCALTAVLGVIAVTIISRFPLTEAGHRQRLAELAEAASHMAPLPGSEAELGTARV
jgi:glycoside/pentoside/hexuronide:cation symporter, GPH family